MEILKNGFIFVNERQTGDMWEWNFCPLMRTFMRARMRITFGFWRSKGPLAMHQGHENKGNKRGKTKKKI